MIIELYNIKQTKKYLVVGMIHVEWSHYIPNIRSLKKIINPVYRDVNENN